jgi:hypothetical protein|nr:MAG TPA: hypothetical protein [Caudoviricetes sp.]
MKKVLVVLAVLAIAVVNVSAQVTSQGKPNVLKSFRMGVCKLIDTNGSITIEAQTRESADYNLIIHLGTPEEAEATLASLAEYKPAKGETVNLNNPGDNTAYFQKLNGTWVIEERIGKYFSIAVSRGELRKMAEALAE